MAATYTEVTETRGACPLLCLSCQALVDWARSLRSIGEREQLVWHQSPADLTASMRHCPFCDFVGSRVASNYFETSDKIHFIVELRRSTPYITMVDCLVDGEFEEDKQFYPYTTLSRTKCRATDVGQAHQRFAVANHPQTYSSSFWIVTDDGG
jgi:hypothetical protein